MNEQDKKPTHYTTGDNGEPIPVYSDTRDTPKDNLEQVNPEEKSEPIYYVTQPDGEIKPVNGGEQTTANESSEDVGNSPIEQTVLPEPAEEPTEIATPEVASDNEPVEELNLPKEDNADKPVSDISEVPEAVDESVNIINEAVEETEILKQNSSEEQGLKKENLTSASETQPSEDAPYKPTEEDLQTVDLKLDQKTENHTQKNKEVEAAAKLINETSKEKGNKKKKGIAAAVAAALAFVGIGVVVATSGGSEETKAPTSTGAEANPGHSSEQVSSVLSGITVEDTLKEFDTKEQKNVITLQEAKDFSSDTTNSPATYFAREQEPESPVADYNVKIFDIMLNGTADEIRDLLKSLGLGPEELKARYDRAIELGAYNASGDMSERAYSHEGWPMGQGLIYGSIDTLNPGIMYNKVWAIAIANAVEVTGGNIPPAQPRDSQTLSNNRKWIESYIGPEGTWTVYFDTDGSLVESDQPGEILTGPPHTKITNPDDLMVIYIDPDNKDSLIVSSSIPTEKLSNPAYRNTNPMPANIGIIIPYGYPGPTSITKYI